MKSCTFFGHRDCPAHVFPHLRAAVEQAILQDGVDTFYVGREEITADVQWNPCIGK